MSTIIHHSHHLFRFPLEPPPSQPPQFYFRLKPKRNRPHTLFFSIKPLHISPDPPLSKTRATSVNSLALTNSISNSSSSKTTETTLLDIDSFLYLLRFSVQYNDFALAKTVHASIIKFHGEEEDTHTSNILISSYLKLGLLRYASRVFLSLSSPNVVSYTSLISGFAKSNLEFGALRLFFRMRKAGIEPNEFTFVAILTACVRIMHLDLGLQVHGLVIKLGFLNCVYVANAVLGFYGKCSGYVDALKLYDEMPYRDIVSINTVMSSLVKESMYMETFDLFRDIDMQKLDYFTLSTLVTACTGSNASKLGREIHGRSIRIGLDGNLSVNNALMVYYTKFGSIEDVITLFRKTHAKDVITWTEMIGAYMEFGFVDKAVEVFEKMPEKNCVSYNCLLAGYNRNNEGLKSLKLFVEMVEGGVELTDSCWTSVIGACGLHTEKKTSEQIHGFCIKLGLESNSFIKVALLYMCTRCGRMEDAENIYCRWPSREDISVICTSMICGYARDNLPDKALLFFHQNYSDGNIVLDEISMALVLSICGTLGFRKMGEKFHCLALKSGLLSDTGVGNSVVSMYSKCCNISDSTQAFNLMTKHDIVSWNSLIAGHLFHRQGDAALALWSKMKTEKVKPDSLTLVYIISAYKYTTSNSIDECRNLFHSMKPDYNIEPNSEHYTSFVSVLGHYGFLGEAEDLIKGMPFEPKVSVLKALLNSCRLHANTTIATRIAKRILTMEPNDPSTYILKSNLYSASGFWNRSGMMRENMIEKGIRKNPSRSWIIHRDEIHSFYARDKSHPLEKDIYSGLEVLILECLKNGYEPDTSFVLHEVEEYQKKNFLYYHSAKLAVIYGILMSNTGDSITIVKNILLCGDCHAFFKHVSVLTQREIIVRDTSGFHCFVNGKCSCKDHW